MTWTYSADPSSSGKDAVRWLIGDTVSTEPVTLQDEEINFNLTEVGGEIYRAAANTAENLAARYTSQATMESKTVGGLELSRSYMDRGKRYLALANFLLLRSRRVNPPIPNADRSALGAEFKVGLLDPYFAIPTGWPNEAVTGVTSTYGTLEEDDSSGFEYSEELDDDL